MGIDEAGQQVKPMSIDSFCTSQDAAGSDNSIRYLIVPPYSGMIL
ncbi:MAG TPA: hypothetical protein VK249_17255 [Anaerolineales bacterium]|nr:hypothetical protein [Anaerolineales bacterium]